jgi:hypothetical protein
MDTLVAVKGNMCGGVGCMSQVLISLLYERLDNEMHIPSRVCVWITHAEGARVINFSDPCHVWCGEGIYTGFPGSVLTFVIAIRYIVTQRPFYIPVRNSFCMSFHKYLFLRLSIISVPSNSDSCKLNLSCRLNIAFILPSYYSNAGEKSLISHIFYFAIIFV